MGGFPAALLAKFDHVKPALRSLFLEALATARANGSLPEGVSPDFTVERTRNRDHGDFATNIALLLSKAAQRKPREVAEAIVAAMPQSDDIARIDIAGPGFINVFMGAAAYQRELHAILSEGDNYGRNDSGQQRRVGVEFVSANPTGPLHVGHGRAAATGDSIARLLEATGWDVVREFYYNDAGVQIENLALSVQARARGLTPESEAWPADGYRGDYIADVAQAYLDGATVEVGGETVVGAADRDNLDAIRRFAVAALRREQDLDLAAFEVRFDVHYLESSLYRDGMVEQTVRTLIDHDKTYEDGGALWLRTTDYGDDKDRVMRKSDGSYTYFVPDVAYHLSKWQRGYTRAVTELGADHHGSLARVKAGLQALDAGIPAGYPEYVLHQMVTVMRGGEEVKLSKRAGSYLTLRDLIDEVGCDATRYFLLARKSDSQLVFDIDLARSQSNDNPVYYIQYAHARVCSVRRQLADRKLEWNRENGEANLGKLVEDQEKIMLTELSRYPEVVDAAATNLDPQLIAQYLRELAAAFHGWYNAHHFIVDDGDLRDARLTLVEASRQVFFNGLKLLGVSAPESM